MNPTVSPALQRVSSAVQSVCLFLWRHATALPRRGHLLHNLITQEFLRSLQYGIVVMGLIDAFVYAHNHHRRNIENPGNFWGLHERKDSLYDCHHSCLCPRVPGHLPDKTHTCSPKSKNFADRVPKSDVRTSPIIVPQHAKEAMTFGDGPSTLMEVLALLMVKL